MKTKILYYSGMKEKPNIQRNLSPELIEIAESHVRGVDKWYRMAGGLRSKLISFEKRTIELEIHCSPKWTKDNQTTALQLAKSWKKNRLLDQANSYLVHLFKSKSPSGQISPLPKVEDWDEKLLDFCDSFVSGLIACQDQNEDIYLGKIEGKFTKEDPNQ